MGQSKGTVYIIDDDDSLRKSTVRLVQTFGYHTNAYDSASAFLELESFEFPGCILLDVQLPDMDGFKLKRVLKEKGCLLPIIFMSGHGDISMGVEVMKKGAVDLLLKPFEPEDLRDAIMMAIVRNSIENKDKFSKER